MSWLRIDDGFMINPKIAELSDKNFRIWMRILTFCARNSSTDGALTGAKKELRGVTDKVLCLFVAAKLIDVGTDGVMRVHDWCDYAPKRSDPTNAQRQAKWRDAQRDVTTPTGSNTSSNVTPRARAVPVPSRPVTTEPKGSSVAAAPRKLSNQQLVVGALIAVYGKWTNKTEEGRYMASAKLLAQSLSGTPPDQYESEIRWRREALERDWNKPCSVNALSSRWSDAKRAAEFVPKVEKKGAMTLADDIHRNGEIALRMVAARDAARNGHYPITADLELDVLEANDG